MDEGQHMKAHQRLIRDERAALDADVDLFGRWWEGLDKTLSKTAVREIDIATAKTVIEKYEWLGTMPAIVLHCFGIFFAGHLGGVVVYSPEYSENLGKWDSYGYTGKMIVLTRGACAHWTPTGTASRLICASMKMLPSKYEIVSATVDKDAGEIGTIYQACNFHYVGVMSKGGKIVSFVRAGKKVSARQTKRDYGTRGRGAADLGALGFSESERKGRYFCFRGSRAAQKKHLAAIRDRIKPYPKRAASPNDAPVPTGASQVEPLMAAPTFQKHVEQ